MGIYTWTDAIRKPLYIESKYDWSSKDKIKYGRFAKVICPDDTEIIESCYDGYGHFGGYDIYELVADWNKDTLSVDILKNDKPSIDNYCGLWSFEINALKKEGKTDKEIEFLDEEAKKNNYLRGLNNWNMRNNRLKDFISGLSDNEMFNKYGKDWKREIGIDIACDDEKNSSLMYPIKITSVKDTVKYKDLYPSYNTQ